MNSQEEILEERNLHDYWELAIRRRWWVLVPAFVAWGIALAVSWYLPPKFKSQTVILVEQPKVSTQYVTPNIAGDLQTRFESLSEQILSRTRLLRIANELNLYPELRSDPDRLVQKMRPDIKVELVAPADREVSGFKISYSSSNPQSAQQVVGRLSSLFIDENLQTQQQLSESTTNFLEAELDGARRDLEHQESELRDFRSRYLGELPDQMQGNMQILGGIQARIDAANQALTHAEQQKLYLNSMLEHSTSSRVLANGETVATPPSIDRRIEQLTAQYSDALAHYTPKHPDVVRLKEQLDEAKQLKKRIEQDSERLANARSGATADSAGPATDPPTMQLIGQLKATELETANRKKEIRDLEQQVALYQSRLNVAPVRDQQLAALTRNYNQSRTNYESLLAKKLQSQMATNLEKRQEGAQFRILDPPNYPRKPYFPKPLNFAMGGLAVGLLLGLGISFGLELLDTRIFCERDIAALGQVVFGTVPPLPTPKEASATIRRRRLEWAVGTVMLAIVPAITLWTYLKG